MRRMFISIVSVVIVVGSLIALALAVGAAWMDPGI
jgi:hypothetical protein